MNKEVATRIAETLYDKGLEGLAYNGSRSAFVEWYTRRAEAFDTHKEEKREETDTEPKSYLTELHEMTEEEAINQLLEIQQQDINSQEKRKILAINKAIQALTKEQVEQQVQRLQEIDACPSSKGGQADGE